MSFILDALKKSENERQRTVGPSLADAPIRTQQTDRPWWAVAVAGLLVGNLAVLLYVLLRNDDTPEPATSPPPAVTAAPAPVYSAPPPAQRARPVAPPITDPSVRSLAEEAGASATQGEDFGTTDQSAGYEEPMPPAPAMARTAEPAASRPVELRGGSGEVLPNASALIASGTSLPDLRLDIHVYSNTPAERFVFINMRKYTEGQTTTEGPSIERITPDGAILNQQGLRFVLPRQ